MTYIQEIKAKLQESFKFSKECESLNYVYALLVLTTGEKTTSENVHDAWSVWQNKTMPKHKSTKLFLELSEEVQKLNEKYRDIIIQISRDFFPKHMSILEKLNKENIELERKIINLNNFLESPEALESSEYEIKLLLMQSESMQNYSKLLSQRIEYYSK